jgi:hypothetical protein
LDSLIARGHITPEGKAAFIAATDPFHDLGIPDLKGWPDLETAPSVVRVVKRSINVKSVEDGGAILIYTLPMIDASINHRATRRNCIIDSITTGVGNDVFVCPLLVNTYNSANANNMGPVNYTSSWPLDIDEGYLTNPTRIIGMGFEVRDVTAEVFKQGTITVFQTTQSQDVLSTYNFRSMVVDGVSYQQTVQTGRPLLAPPTSTYQALLYPGTRQWEAKNGAYCVIPFSSKDNIARAPEYTMPVFRPAGITDEVGQLNTGTIFTGPYASGSPPNDSFVFEPHCYAPMHSKGVMITGLNSNSTFQINLNIFLETFPNIQNDALLTLASSSAPYDPIALEMISYTSKNMPVGVPVDQNSMGDFFAELVANVAPLVGGIASTFFPEFAPLIAPVAAGAANIAKKSISDRAQRKAAAAEKRQKGRAAAAKVKTPPPVNPNVQLTRAQKKREQQLRIKEARM